MVCDEKGGVWIALGFGLDQRRGPMACVTSPHRLNWVLTSACLVPTHQLRAPSS